MQVRDLIPPAEAARFTASEGGVFPTPQYSNGAVALVPAPSSCTPSPSTEASPRPSGSQGVVLVGDALHCFPPDLGQGVNSALVDAAALASSLDASGGDVAQALSQYEAARLPEAAALCRLVRSLNPYQYTQDPVRRNLWTLGFAWRQLLAAVTAWAGPWAIPPHGFLLFLQRPDLTYAQVEAAEKRGAALSAVIACASAACLLGVAVVRVLVPLAARAATVRF